MSSKEKIYLERETSLRELVLRIKMGVEAIKKSQQKRKNVMIYSATIWLLWLLRHSLVDLSGDEILHVLIEALTDICIAIYATLGLVIAVILQGFPKGAVKTANDLHRAGIVNRAGEAPILLALHKDPQISRITIMEFDDNGIPRSEWEDNQARIEAALNVHIAKISEGKDRRRILLHTVPASGALPQMIHWNDCMCSEENFVLVLGESAAGPVTVDLRKIPHILLGGSTGSGKSILLKLLLKQAMLKGAQVFIADFKGGVDFPGEWKRLCQLCTTEEELLDILTKIVDELERRKGILSGNGMANIDEYNSENGAELKRIVFACDEVAEILDKTGLEKSQKMQVYQIENKLSAIARQGRAFGIHLILATQRPDATILSGQIRNNLDCRICGRADNVLSQIILDRTDAADLIPKDISGRFLLHDGTVFQAYYASDEQL